MSQYDTIDPAVSGRPRRYYRIGSLEKGLRIVELLARQGPASLSEVAVGLDLDKSACHRSLLTMRDLGFVEQKGGSGYKLTMKLFELAMQVVHALEIRQVVRPFLEDLGRRLRETVNLAIKDGADIIYLDKYESNELLRAELAVGTRIPVHCTALGKAILAFRPERERREFLSRGPLKAHTPRTITRPEDLAAEIELIRTQGYAIDDEEHYLGVRCVAAPLLDYTGYPTYSISLAAPSSRVSRQRLEEMSRDLKEVCARISKLLGHGAAPRPGQDAPVQRPGRPRRPLAMAGTKKEEGES